MVEFIYLEPNSNGHSLFWADLFYRLAIDHPHVEHVKFIVPEKLGRQLAELKSKDQVEIQYIAEEDRRKMTVQNRLLSGFRQWRFCCKQMLGRNKPILFLPFIDHAIFGASIWPNNRGGKIGGIVFRYPNNYNQKSSLMLGVQAWIKGRLYKMAGKENVQLFSFDQDASENLQIIYDPIDFQAINYDQRTKRDRTIFLMFGAIAERKGIFQLLDALHYLPEDVKRKIEIRFVGHVKSAKIKAAILQAKRDHAGLKITHHFQFTSQDHLEKEVQECDVILAPYLNHIGSSGVVLWAASFAKRIISQQSGLMGQMVRQHSLGLCVNPYDAKQLADALVRSTHQEFKGNRRFLRNHDPKDFVYAILDSLV